MPIPKKRDVSLNSRISNNSRSVAGSGFSLGTSSSTCSKSAKSAPDSFFRFLYKSSRFVPPKSRAAAAMSVIDGDWSLKTTTSTERYDTLDLAISRSAMMRNKQLALGGGDFVGDGNGRGDDTTTATQHNSDAKAGLASGSANETALFDVMDEPGQSSLWNILSVPSSSSSSGSPNRAYSRAVALLKHPLAHAFSATSKELSHHANRSTGNRSAGSCADSEDGLYLCGFSSPGASLVDTDAITSSGDNDATQTSMTSPSAAPCIERPRATTTSQPCTDAMISIEDRFFSQLNCCDVDQLADLRSKRASCETQIVCEESDDDDAYTMLLSDYDIAVKGISDKNQVEVQEEYGVEVGDDDYNAEDEEDSEDYEYYDLDQHRETFARPTPAITATSKTSSLNTSATTLTSSTVAGAKEVETERCDSASPSSEGDVVEDITAIKSHLEFLRLQTKKLGKTHPDVKMLEEYVFRKQYHARRVHRPQQQLQGRSYGAGKSRYLVSSYPTYYRSRYGDDKLVVLPGQGRGDDGEYYDSFGSTVSVNTSNAVNGKDKKMSKKGGTASVNPIYGHQHLQEF